VVIPARPAPPSGAVSIMAIPAVGVDGMRLTVNYNLSTAQTLWNMRSALNVAALNCQGPEYAGILPAYSSLLTKNKRQLTATNKEVTKEFKARYGSEGLKAQDNYMTQVYNYFALPPAQNEFCRAASLIANESLMVAPDDLEVFAVRSLQTLEGVFEDFYRSYEQYRVNVAMWDARYGEPTSVNPASYTGPAIYTPADQGFGPEQTGAPIFISEPMVEGAAGPEIVEPSSDVRPSFGLEARPPQLGPAQVPGDPAFVSEPVVEPIPGSDG